MAFPHTALDLDKALSDLIESHEKAFSSLLLEEKRNGLTVSEGPPHFTRTTFNPKTGEEKHFRRELGSSESEEYDGIEEYTWTEHDTKTGIERHYRSRRENGSNVDDAGKRRSTTSGSRDSDSDEEEGTRSGDDSIDEAQEQPQGQRQEEKEEKGRRPRGYRQSQEGLKFESTATDFTRAIESKKVFLVHAAQSVYDEWEQDFEYGDTGGICDSIQNAMWSILDDIDGIDIREWGHDGDEHAALIVQRGTEQYVVDIPYWKYEEHFGIYNWRKIEGVKFSPSDVEITPI